MLYRFQTVEQGIKQGCVPPPAGQRYPTAITFLLLTKNAKRRDEIRKKLQQLSTL